MITDLNPKTNYRFRLAPLIITKGETNLNGEWSEPITVQTKEL